MDSSDQITNIGRSTNINIAGVNYGPATNVTVNALNATQYGDNTFSKGSLTLVDGTNTFTAVAQDNYGRTDTNTVAAWLPASINCVYDQNGNLTFDGLKAYEWDDENQLTRLTVTNAWKSEFSYDGKMRRRIRREYTWASSAWVLTTEVRYIFDGDLVLQERNGWNLATVSYTRGSDLSRTMDGAGGIGGLLARTDHGVLLMNPSAAHAYYHADANGNVTTLINSNQQVVASYLYESFGTILAMSGALAEANLYRFSSKELHEPSGLLHYMYRYYDSRFLRWLNRDPLGEAGFELLRVHQDVLGDGPNLYLFVHNNPVNLTDAFGLSGIDDMRSLKFKLQQIINAIKELETQKPLSPARQAQLRDLYKQLNDVLTKINRLKSGGFVNPRLLVRGGAIAACGVAGYAGGRALGNSTPYEGGGTIDENVQANFEPFWKWWYGYDY